MDIFSSSRLAYRIAQHLIVLILLLMMLISPGFAQEPVRFMVQSQSQVGEHAISPDGRLLAICRTNEILLWNLEQGRSVSLIGGLMGSCKDAVFSPDGKYLLTAGYDDGAAILWNCSAGELSRRFASKDYGYESVGFDENGQHAIAGHSGGCVALDVDTGEIVQLVTENDDYSFNWANVSDGGIFVAIKKYTNATKHELVRYDPVRGKAVNKKKIDVGKLSSIDTPSSDGRYGVEKIIRTGTDSNGEFTARYIHRIWDIEKAKLRSTVVTSHATYGLNFSPDGTYVTAGSVSSASHYKPFVTALWDTNTGEPIWSRERTYGAEWLPGGNRVVVFLEEGYEVLDVPSGDTTRKVSTFNGAAGGVFLGPNELLWGGARWDVGDAELVSHRAPDDGWLSAPSFSTNLCLRYQEEKPVEVVDIRTMRTVCELAGTNGVAWSPILSPSGKLAGRVVSFYPSTGAYIQIWDAASGRETHKILVGESEHDQVGSLAIAPNDEWCVVAVDKWGVKHTRNSQLQFWSLTEQSKVSTRDNDGVIHGTAFSPDGSMIAFSIRSYQFWGDSPSDVRVLRVEDDTVVHAFEGERSPRFSLDGLHLTTIGQRGGRVSRWNLQSGKRVNSFPTGSIDGILESPDGKYLAGFGAGKLTVWNLDQNQLLYDAVLDVDTGEYLVWTEDGYYMGSDYAARNFCHVVQGIETYAMDQFFDQFYNPAMVHARIRGLDVNANKIETALNTFPPPKVEILSPKAAADGTVAAKGDRVEVTVTARDTGGGVREIRVYHNGKRVGGTWSTVAEYQLTSSGGVADRGILGTAAAAPSSSSTAPTPAAAAGLVPPGDKTETYEIQLLNGENTIRVSAVSSGMVESDSQSIVVIHEGADTKPRLHVVTVGVNQYRDDNVADLGFAQPDALAFAEQLTDHSPALFGNFEIASLYNADATRDSVLAALRELETKAAVGDMVVFYFAGHGISLASNGRFYLVTHDADVPESGLLSASRLEGGISEVELGSALMRIPALKQVIFLDACQSGGSDFSAVFREASQDVAVRRLNRAAGTWVFSASGKTENALETKEQGHGLFTYALLNGMQGQADTLSSDGIVTLEEMGNYVVQEVSSLAARWNHQQVPQVQRGRDDFALTATR